MKKILTLFFIVNLLLAAESKVDEVLFDSTMRRLEVEMQEAVRRQTVYAHIIANAGLEEYKPIRFADELQDLKQRPGFKEEEDSVIVEEEMSKMTKNHFRHSTLSRLYNMKITNLKTVVKQGR